jgi:hypothetical protein
LCARIETQAHCPFAARVNQHIGRLLSSRLVTFPILSAYVQRQNNKVVTPSPVLAPPELLDDDPEHQKKN